MPKLLKAHTARRSLSIQHMDAFRAVMIAGTVNAAARQLNVSQPSLSRMLFRVEDLIGFALFDRVKGRLLPTTEARTLFSTIQHVREQLEGLDVAIEQIATQGRGRFRLGASPSLARSIVPKALARFRQRFPKVPIHFDTVTIPNVVDYLALGNGECFFTIMPIHHPIIQSRAIWPGRLVCLLPASHKLAARTRVHVRDLISVPLIIGEPDTLHGQMAQQIFDKLGKKLTTSVTVRVAETAIGFVAEGLGVAILDEFTAMGAQSDRIAVRPLAVTPRFHVYVNHNKAVAQSRYVQTLEVAILDVLRGQVRAR